MFRKANLLLLLVLFLTACDTAAPTPIQPGTTAIPSSTATTAILPSALPPPLSPTPQPLPTPISYGPDLENFLADVNPLTGRQVQDPSLLKLPAVLVSISNMPFTARPQAGPGFAPWVYELYIGEGATRFMNVFYGQYPRSIPNLLGGCEVREKIFHPKGDWIGNRVWLDENTNGRAGCLGGRCRRCMHPVGGRRKPQGPAGDDHRRQRLLCLRSSGWGCPPAISSFQLLSIHRSRMLGLTILTAM